MDRRSDIIRFGVDGWKARFDDGFDAEGVARVADALGLVWADAAPGGTIYVGYDTRHNARELALLAAGVIASYGLVVKVSEGPCPTPAVAWCCSRDESAYGAVIITEKEREYQIRVSGEEQANALLASLSGSALDPKFGNPSSYIHLFASHSDLLDIFLSDVVKRPQPCDASTWNALLELALRKEAEPSQPESQTASEVVVQRRSSVMSILTDPRAAYDEEEALILVQTYNSAEGQVYLYKKLGMYSLLLQHYLQHNDPRNCIAVCKTFGEQSNDLWLQLLTMLAQQSELNLALIREILDYIEKTNVVPLLTALQIVSQNDNIQLGMVKQFIIRHVRRRRGAVQTVPTRPRFACRIARKSATS